MDIQELANAIETRDAAMAATMTAVKSTAGDTKTKAEEALARLDELDQKIARRGDGHDGGGEVSWGEQFVKGVDLGAFSENVTKRKQSEGLLMKTTLTSAGGSAGNLTRPYRDEAVIMPKRRLTIRNLLPTIRINTGVVEYPKQTARPSAAAMVAEGALKPESAMTFDLVSTTAKVIAHWIPASRQILDDAPQLAGLIDSELRHGLELKEEEQILSGSGTGENLSGLITSATTFSAPVALTGSNTMIDVVGNAILQAALANYEPDGIVMHPADWFRIRTIKNVDGDYVFGDPATSGTATLWGLPVVPTQAMAVDKFLVGQFQAAATIYDRWLPRVEVSTEHADFFVRNLVAILAEERLALAVKNGGALVYGDFGNAP